MIPQTDAELIKQRHRFEAAYGAKHPCRHFRMSNGRYDDWETQAAWELWQVAISEPAWRVMAEVQPDDKSEILWRVSGQQGIGIGYYCDEDRQEWAVDVLWIYVREITGGV